MAWLLKWRSKSKKRCGSFANTIAATRDLNGPVSMLPTNSRSSVFTFDGVFMINYENLNNLKTFSNVLPIKYGRIFFDKLNFLRGSRPRNSSASFRFRSRFLHNFQSSLKAYELKVWVSNAWRGVNKQKNVSGWQEQGWIVWLQMAAPTGNERSGRPLLGRSWLISCYKLVSGTLRPVHQTPRAFLFSRRCLQFRRFCTCVMLSLTFRA